MLCMFGGAFDLHFKKVHLNPMYFSIPFSGFASMGEIDTKPIESVQVAISLFGERKDDSPTKNEVSIAYICIKILRYLNLVEELNLIAHQE